MCMSAPKVPTPPPPPAPPPPPTKTAQKVDTKAKRSESSKKRGTSALTIRRSSVNTGSSGTGANISY